MPSIAQRSLSTALMGTADDGHELGAGDMPRLVGLAPRIELRHERAQMVARAVLKVVVERDGCFVSSPGAHVGDGFDVQVLDLRTHRERPNMTRRAFGDESVVHSPVAFVAAGVRFAVPPVAFGSALSGPVLESPHAAAKSASPMPKSRPIAS